MCKSNFSFPCSSQAEGKGISVVSVISVAIVAESSRRDRSGVFSCPVNVISIQKMHVFSQYTSMHLANERRRYSATSPFIGRELPQNNSVTHKKCALFCCALLRCVVIIHDDVIKWKHFPRYWLFVRWIHLSPVNSSIKASYAELWCFLWSHPNKRLSKQWWDWWFETPSCQLWRHRNGIPKLWNMC